MGTVLKLALDDDVVALCAERLGIADLGDVKLLRDLRTHLGGVAVDGLAAGDDQVEADFTQCGGEDGGGGIGVGAAELPGGEEVRLVRAHGQRLPQGDVRLGRTHTDDGHRSAHLLPELERGLQAGLVVMVDDGGNALADEGIGLRVQLHLGGIGDLLDTNNNLHSSALPFLTSASWSRR